ncbi:MAG: ParB/RepB/Spo0J family partition protein [Flavobacteriales bacterium]|nr:ParB/RepB/Spo0J family partition protein [Flavobacteriales bacterium]
MSKKRGLGKGLSALLESVETDITTGVSTESTERVLGSVAMLPVEAIEANPFQPRTVFEEEPLMELVQSIQELGIIQPVTVRKLGHDRFQLISGERRFRASQIAGFADIPAYIRVANDQAMLEMALVENIQRRNLDPIEIAISYQRLIEECNLTQEAMSQRVGKKRATVSNYLRLLKLPPKIQMALRESQITMGHARALLAFRTEREMLRAFDEIVSQGLSVRKTEEIGKESKKKVIRPKRAALSFEQQKFKSDLMDRFGTKVDIKRDQKGKGKIEITFASDDQLRRIVQILEE